MCSGVFFRISHSASVPLSCISNLLPILKSIVNHVSDRHCIMDVRLVFDAQQNVCSRSPQQLLSAATSLSYHKPRSISSGAAPSKLLNFYEALSIMELIAPSLWHAAGASGLNRPDTRRWPCRPQCPAPPERSAPQNARRRAGRWRRRRSCSNTGCCRG